MNYRVILTILLSCSLNLLDANEQPVATTQAQITQPLPQQLPVPAQAQSFAQRQSLVRSSRIELRGCIKVDNAKIDKVPEYRIYYQGREQRTNSEGFFALPLEDKNINKYSLIICKKIEQQFEQSNTVAHYGVIPDKEYRYFTFKRGNHQQQWLAQEKRLTKKQFIIPEHAIVALIDPKCIERLDPWDLNLADHIIKLPAIVLKKDLDQKKLNRYAAKSMLYSLDSRPFHLTERLERKGAQNNQKVQLVLDR